MISIPFGLVFKNMNYFLAHSSSTLPLLYSSIFSFLGFIITYKMIPNIMLMTLKSGLKGVDVNKCVNYKDPKDPNYKEVPESLGIVPAVVFLMVSILSQMFMSLTAIQKLEYNASLLSICFMIFLGFSDDVLDLRWRYKLLLPLIASMPIIFAYEGATDIVFPDFIARILGIKSLELGIIYKIYMCLLAIFCTNSINIYAGINGLEVGQSLVISICIVVYNLIDLVKNNKIFENVFSITIVMPFFACSLGLFLYNKYPSVVFVGDTYTYFAGMTFACAGILGHFSKTILFFFIPQILNFIISFPQLIGVFPCSRHRLPQYNEQTGLISGRKEHHNLLNISLRILGPQREQDICNYLIMFQVVCSGVALFFRIKFFNI